MHVSPNHLTRCFRQETGLTPVAYLNRYRIQQAKELLKRTDSTITRIATEVGFSDGSYFARVFQREEGVSPSAYRRGGCLSSRRFVA
ncbi:MAG: helix-turn-helix transcriptional regulator [Anaerolineae bacterium]